MWSGREHRFGSSHDGEGSCALVMLTVCAQRDAFLGCWQIEQEEEHIANRLLKRLDQLKQEKQVSAPHTKDLVRTHIVQTRQCP